MEMLFLIFLEVLLAAITLTQLGIKVSLVAFGAVLVLYAWASTYDIKGRYLPLQRVEIPWLYDGIAEMTRKANIPMPRIYLLDDYIPTAYSFKNAVVLSLGLFEVLDQEEILAVAAHEIGHIKNGDTRTFPLLAYGRYLMLVFTIVLMVLARNTTLSVSALALVGLYEIAWARFHKEREFLADEAALRLLKTPMSLKHALEELKYYEDLRTGMRSNAVPSIEPTIERRQKQRPLIIETHPSYDERVLRIIIEINGNRMIKNHIQ
ncbi:M48 family metalloprotease [Thermococcus sp.]|uniref:M48 family metallopeptidase n=1 Tax=Thermococcus sp. TaxID=35749 RepID=UPI003457CF8D